MKYIRACSRKEVTSICFFFSWRSNILEHTRPISTSAVLSILISAKLFIVRASSRKVLFLYEAHLV